VASTSLSTPHKERPRKSPLATLDEFNEALVRRTITDFYIVEKQRLTLRKVGENLRETLDFYGMHLHIKENYFETGVPLEHNHNIL
jgi:hypothetical protein